MERLNGPGYLLRENPIVAPLLRLAHQRGRHRAFAGQVLGLMNAPLVPAASPGAEPLSARELEVLRVLVEGAGNREIAGRLFISETTVKTHVQRILRKLNAASRAQAAARARELMLV
jgi:DNA-binding NarL/FixJ family response regulator